MKAFVSWSGGKETSLSLYRAMKRENMEISHLLNMVSEDGRRSRSHGVSSKLLREQAEAIGIPIMQRKSTWNTYEEEFKKALTELKKQGVEAGVFGDIDVEAHRDWVERVCREMDIKAILPLWQGKREDLLEEFMKVGFKAVVVACQPQFKNEGWIGREINREFIEGLKKRGGVDLCGENGEYHTFVYNGPVFKKPVKNFLSSKK